MRGMVFSLKSRFGVPGGGGGYSPRPVEARGYLPLRFFFLGVQVMAVSLPLGLRLRLPGDVTAGAAPLAARTWAARRPWR